MSMIETEAGGLRHEFKTLHAVRRYERRAFLSCAVDCARYDLTVHVDQLRRVGIVVDVDYDPPAFLEAQERSRELAIVKCRGHDVFGASSTSPVAMRSV